MYIIVVVQAKGYPEQYIHNSHGGLTYMFYTAHRFFPEQIPEIMGKILASQPPYSIRLMSIPE